MYKQIRIPPDQINNSAIQRMSDGAFVPFDPSNSDYQVYLKWLDGYEKQPNAETGLPEWVKTSEGNTPLPADE